MVRLLARLLLAVLLFGDQCDWLAAAESTARGVADASSPDDDSCFIPIALRYREEATQRISSHLLASAQLPREGCDLFGPRLTQHPEQVDPLSLSSLDPVYAFMCVRR